MTLLADNQENSTMLLVAPASTSTICGPSVSLKGHATQDEHTKRWRSLDGLADEVEHVFSRHTRLDSLLSLSWKLQEEMKARLQSCGQCMLPSHNYTLPTGQEEGTYIALDVGGSTLRAALVDLKGRQRGSDSVQLRRIQSTPIDRDIRALSGPLFFDWIAQRIRDLLLTDKEIYEQMQGHGPLSMGMAWSFPVEQTSVRSGRILSMGKGFLCSGALVGQDLGELMTEACRRAHLNIQLNTVINDSSAALISCAYEDHSVRMAIILGTGMNAAVQLPVTSFHPSKFNRPSIPKSHEYHQVLVNTELGMFGKTTFPITRWDESLNGSHANPNYQPFEYLVTGAYISELVRLIIVEATRMAGLFGGSLPPSLVRPYSLDTRTIAAIEIDSSPSLVVARTQLQTLHPCIRTPTYSDLHFVQRITRAVSHRSSAYFIAGIHALCSVTFETQGAESSSDDVRIACEGSVINNYPHYFEKCQALLHGMVEKVGFGRRKVILTRSNESAITGAGIAAAMATVHDQ